MPSFRFCRPDDIPLLVEAVNRCYDIHFPHVPPLTLEGFKREVKHLNLWASSCMLALENNVPVGVLITAKRNVSSLILRLGLQPDYQGHNYGPQLVTSLKDKMAVLGPPALTVAIPDNREDLGKFFGKLDFKAHRNYCDFTASTSLSPPVSPELIIPVEVEDPGDRYLTQTGENNQSDETLLAWERRTQTLINRKKEIKGLGIPDMDGIAAYLFYIEDESANVSQQSPVTILGLGCKSKEKGPMLLGLLIKYVSTSISPLIDIPKLSTHEVDFYFLEKLGLKKIQSYTEYCVVTKTDN